MMKHSTTMRAPLNSLSSLAIVLLSLAGMAPSCGQLTQAGAPGTLNRRSAQRNTVERIVDGDTVELTDASGATETVRIQGIDTPEKHGSSKMRRDAERSRLAAAIKALGVAATEQAQQLLPVESAVRVVGSTRGKYGRLVGNRRSAKRNAEGGVDTGAPFDFGARMIERGFAHSNRRSAKRNDGGGRFPHEREQYYDQLEPRRGPRSERQARATSAGLWAGDPGTSASLASLGD
jgi:micrococcal nuclease